MFVSSSSRDLFFNCLCLWVQLVPVVDPGILQPLLLSMTQHDTVLAVLLSSRWFFCKSSHFCSSLRPWEKSRTSEDSSLFCSSVKDKQVKSHFTRVACSHLCGHTFWDVRFIGFFKTWWPVECFPGRHRHALLADHNNIGPSSLQRRRQHHLHGMWQRAPPPWTSARPLQRVVSVYVYVFVCFCVCVACGL